MRKKLLSLATMLLVATVATMAQTRYCLSYEDFKNDKWVTLEDSLQMGIKVSLKEFQTGRSEIYINHSNKKIDEILKKEARFIIYKDMLFTNLQKLRFPKGHRLFGKYYTLSFRYEEDKVCFIAPQSITAKKFLNFDKQVTNFCYVIESDELNVKQIKAEEISALLAKSSIGPGLYETYSKEEKESAEILIPQLKKLDLLKPY